MILNTDVHNSTDGTTMQMNHLNTIFNGSRLQNYFLIGIHWSMINHHHYKKCMAMDPAKFSSALISALGLILHAYS